MCLHIVALQREGSGRILRVQKTLRIMTESTRSMFRFYEGKPPKPTIWSMEEFALLENEFQGLLELKDLVICKLDRDISPPMATPELRRGSRDGSQISHGVVPCVLNSEAEKVPSTTTDNLVSVSDVPTAETEMGTSEAPSVAAETEMVTLEVPSTTAETESETEMGTPNLPNSTARSEVNVLELPSGITEAHPDAASRRSTRTPGEMQEK